MSNPEIVIDALDRPIWGTKAIGEIIGKNPPQTLYLLQKSKLDADKIGDQWATTARRLLHKFSRSSLTAA
jgi:hypothetical protein